MTPLNDDTQEMTEEQARKYEVYSLTNIRSRPGSFVATLCSRDLPNVLIRLEYKRSMYNRVYSMSDILENTGPKVNFTTELILARKIEEVVKRFNAVRIPEEKCQETTNFI